MSVANKCPHSHLSLNEPHLPLESLKSATQDRKGSAELTTGTEYESIPSFKATNNTVPFWIQPALAPNQLPRLWQLTLETSSNLSLQPVT